MKKNSFAAHAVFPVLLLLAYFVIHILMSSSVYALVGMGTFFLILFVRVIGDMMGIWFLIKFGISALAISYAVLAVLLVGSAVLEARSARTH